MSLTPFLAFAFGLAALLALFALLQVGGARRSWRSRRRAGATTRLVVSLVLLGCAGFAALVGTALLGWRRLAAEALVATIDTRALDAQRYAVGVELPDGTRHEVELDGDDWQLDARVIKWKTTAVVLGAPPLYRLERIGGRWHSIEQARSGPYTVHALADPATSIDPWVLLRGLPDRVDMIDADYGSAAWLPMVDGGRYTVTLAASGGLVARPADASTAEALRAAGWFAP